jgi:hypothetical protein
MSALSALNYPASQTPKGFANSDAMPQSQKKNNFLQSAV